MDTSSHCVDDGRAESAEENVEQDDTMEKSDVDNDSTTGTYVSCYPNTRRYSLANSMATNTRPPYRTDNQGYSVDMGGEDAKAGKETKIDIPTSQPPQYSAVHEKMADKKVKVCKIVNFYDEKEFRWTLHPVPVDLSQVTSKWKYR